MEVAAAESQRRPPATGRRRTSRADRVSRAACNAVSLPRPRSWSDQLAGSSAPPSGPVPRQPTERGAVDLSTGRARRAQFAEYLSIHGSAAGPGAHGDGAGVRTRRVGVSHRSRADQLCPSFSRLAEVTQVVASGRPAWSCTTG